MREASKREAFPLVTGRERRPDLRRRARQPSRFRIKLGSTSSTTVDVSADGFSAESARPLHRGDDVEGVIRVNGSDIAFGGRVVWVKRIDDTVAPQTRLGIRFTRVPWDLQKLLDAPAIPAGR